MSRKLNMLIWCFCLLPMGAHGQPVKDSIQLLIENAATDSARAKYHNEMATVLFYENVDSALYHAKRAQNMAKAAGLPAEEAQAHYAAAVLYSVQGNREKQLFHLSRSLQLAKQAKDSTKIHSVIIEQALLQMDKGRMAEALQKLQQSLDYARHGGENLLYSLYYIAALHLEMGNDSLGLAYEQRVISLIEQLDQPLLHTQILIQTGKSLINAGQWAEAEKRLQKGLEMAKQQESNNSIALALQGLAEVNINHQRYDLANDQLQQALALCLQDDFKPAQLTVILTQLDLLIQTQQFEHALRFYRSQYPGVASFRHSNDQQLFLWSTLKKIYQQTGHYKQAYQAQDSVLFYQSRQLAEDEQKAVAALESEYQLQLEQDRRDALALEIQKRKLAISKRRTLLVVLSAMLVILTVSAALAFLLTNLASKRYERKLQQSIAQDTAQLRKVNHKLKDVRLRLEAFFRLTASYLKGPLLNIQQDLAKVKPEKQLPGEKEAEAYYLFLEKGEQQMYKLIKGIRAFAAVHNTTLRIESTDLGSLMSDIFQEAVARFPEKRVALQRETPLPAIEAPEALLRSVLSHLIPNAIHFTPGKKAIVKAGYRRAGQHHEIWISDFGIGIEPEFQERIFDLFYRLQDRGQNQNPGLGLPLAQKLAQQMGGALRVKSAPGKGSTFILRIPVQQS